MQCPDALLCPCRRQLTGLRRSSVKPYEIPPFCVVVLFAWSSSHARESACQESKQYRRRVHQAVRDSFPGQNARNRFVRIIFFSKTISVFDAQGFGRSASLFENIDTHFGTSFFSKSQYGNMAIMPRRESRQGRQTISRRFIAGIAARPRSKSRQGRQTIARRFIAGLAAHPRQKSRQGRQTIARRFIAGVPATPRPESRQGRQTIARQ